MEIHCKHCRYVYDAALYGEECPNCHMDNTVFRSGSARKMMGYETDSLRERYFSNDRAERVEELWRSGDPLHGKSALRRTRPYFMLLVLVFAVAILGTTFRGMGSAAREERAAQPKPPVSQLASAEIGVSFEPVDGVALRVLYAGVVPEDQLGRRPRGRQACVFVDVRASSKGARPEQIPGKLLLRADGELYEPGDPVADGGTLWDYTAFDAGELLENGTAAGQFFFYVPAKAQNLALCWQTDQGDQAVALPML